MKIDTDRENGTLIAKAEGRIDGVNAREFEKTMTTIMNEKDKALIMDFQDLSYISSAGLRVILLLAKSLRKRNTTFMICSLSDPIKEVFEISGFNKILRIYASRVEALTALDG